MSNLYIIIYIYKYFKSAKMHWLSPPRQQGIHGIWIFENNYTTSVISFHLKLASWRLMSLNLFVIDASIMWLIKRMYFSRVILPRDVDPANSSVVTLFIISIFQHAKSIQCALFCCINIYSYNGFIFCVYWYSAGFPHWQWCSPMIVTLP